LPIILKFQPWLAIYLLEFLRIKVIKEEEMLKHLIEENKELPPNL
jgi:hypothetical protein